MPAPQVLYPPVGYAQPLGNPARTAVLTAPPVVDTTITSDPRPRQSWVWRAIKWPIRNALKVIYYIGTGVKRHRAVAAVLAVLLLGLLGGAFVVYHVTNPGGVGAGQQSAASGQTNQTPFTIVEPAQPPLPPSVIQWLHGNETFNAQEIWDSYSPQFQQALQQRGITVKSLQDGLNQSQQGGLTVEQFIYAGGFDSPTGYSHYSVEIVLAQGNRRGIQDWYFITDPNGKIVVARNLSPQ